MSQLCIHISDAQHRHEWGYSPTVGTYTCMKCSERRNYNDPQYAEAEREYQAQVRNMQQSSDTVERVARLRRFIETRKRIASPSAADEQSLIADLEAIIAEASHHAELLEELSELRARVGAAEGVLNRVGKLLMECADTPSANHGVKLSLCANAIITYAKERDVAQARLAKIGGEA